jgi:hypothetical protein
MHDSLDVHEALHAKFHKLRAENPERVLYNVIADEQFEAWAIELLRRRREKGE